MAEASLKKNTPKKNGYVLRVAGTVIDVQFEHTATPTILNKLIVSLSDNGKERSAALEVAQQLGDGIVRCIAIESLFGIRGG